MNKIQRFTNKVNIFSIASYGLLLVSSLLVGCSAVAENQNYGTDSSADIVSELSIDEETASSLFSIEELQDLVAPIALYPDDLLGIVLPATTYPIQIVQATRFLQSREKDESLEADSAWDDSIIALLNYPEALTLLNDDLDWTWQLGEAVISQHEDVLMAVANFRQLARTAGNLESDTYQTVEVLDDGAIEIRPANPEVIYVPYYEPRRVIYYSRRPVYHYYPSAYPVYYYPYPADYAFSSSFFWGVTSSFSIGWRTHRLHVHHYGYAGHPYASRSYSYNHHYYRRPQVSVTYTQNFNEYYESGGNKRRRQHHAGNYWQPKHRRSGTRPRVDTRNYNPEVVGTDRRRIVKRKEGVVRNQKTRKQRSMDREQIDHGRLEGQRGVQQEERRERKQSRVVRSDRPSKDSKNTPRTVSSKPSGVQRPGADKRPRADKGPRAAQLSDVRETRKEKVSRIRAQRQEKASRIRGERAQRVEPRVAVESKRRANTSQRRAAPSQAGAPSPAKVQGKPSYQPKVEAAAPKPSREKADKPSRKKKEREEARESSKERSSDKKRSRERL